MVDQCDLYGKDVLIIFNTDAGNEGLAHTLYQQAVEADIHNTIVLRRDLNRFRLKHYKRGKI